MQFFAYQGSCCKDLNHVIFWNSSNDLKIEKAWNSFQLWRIQIRIIWKYIWANLNVLCSQGFFTPFILHSHIPRWSSETKTPPALSPSLTCSVEQHWEIALFLNIYALSHVLKPKTQWLRGSLHTLSHLPGFGRGEKESTLAVFGKRLGGEGEPKQAPWMCWW